MRVRVVGKKQIPPETVKKQYENQKGQNSFYLSRVWSQGYSQCEGELGKFWSGGATPPILPGLVVLVNTCCSGITINNALFTFKSALFREYI